MDKIEIRSFDEEGYQPVISYETWRVAMLNYIDELEPNKIDNVQAHLKTDESFILLRGKCILYLCDVLEDTITNIEAVDMKPYHVYNIKKGVYHTHTLSEDAKVLIVENEDTTDDNSPKIIIGPSVQETLLALQKECWNHE